MITSSKGFSLLELIITIVLIGILSVVASSRFQSASGFDTFALQGQVLTSLRHMQFRAMQDTRPDYCHRLIFDISEPEIGIPSTDYSDNTLAAAGTCESTIGADSPAFLSVDSNRFRELGASLSALDGSSSIGWIDFDSLGRPLTPVNNCGDGCEITLTAQSSSSVCINREGFIRAC
jgi:MSHA pilin protein MshC